jgi:hypothetical protein
MSDYQHRDGEGGSMRVEVDTRAMDARLRAFADAFWCYSTRNPPLVQLVPEFEPYTVAFWREYPDRVLCGRVAFEAMRTKGFDEAPPLAPPVVPPLWPEGGT